MLHFQYDHKESIKNMDVLLPNSEGRFKYIGRIISGCLSRYLNLFFVGNFRTLSRSKATVNILDKISTLLC